MRAFSLEVQEVTKKRYSTTHTFKSHKAGCLSSKHSYYRRDDITLTSLESEFRINDLR